MSSYSYTPNIQEFIPLIVIYVVILAVVLVAGLVDYILRGIAIHNMSKNRGISNGVLGFIPIARDYQFGALAGEIEIGSKRMKHPGLWLVLAPIIYGTVFSVLYFLFLFGTLFTIIPAVERGANANDALRALPLLFVMLFAFVLVMAVGQIVISLLRYLVLHKIFSFYSAGQKPVFYLILSMFVPMAESILLFRHRHRPLLGQAAPPAGPGNYYGAPAPVYGPAPIAVQQPPPHYQGPSDYPQPGYPNQPVNPATPPVPPAPPAPPHDVYNPTDMHDNW